MSSTTQFDKLSEEALRLVKQAGKAARNSIKIKEIHTELDNLKKSLDETVIERLSTSQQ